MKNLDRKIGVFSCAKDLFEREEIKIGAKKGSFENQGSLIAWALQESRGFHPGDAHGVGDDGEEEARRNDFRCQAVVRAHFPRKDKAVDSAGRGPKDVGDAQFHLAHAHGHAQGNEEKGCDDVFDAGGGEDQGQVVFQ